MFKQPFTILEEDNDDNYEPTKEELIEYAAFLGMSPRSDAKYLYIAREGLKTPLPTPWKPAELPNGEIAYYNLTTKVLQENHPLDDFFRRKYIEAKKKDVQNQQPSKTSKKLKGLCEQLREPNNDSEIPTQKTDRKITMQQQQLESSQLNDCSFIQEQLDLIENQLKFEMLQYEQEQESFLQIYKKNKEKQFNEEKKNINIDSDFDLNQQNIPDKAIKLRQEFINKKEQISNNLQEDFEFKERAEKDLLIQQHESRINEYERNKEKQLKQNVTQIKNQESSKLDSLKMSINEMKKILEDKKIMKQTQSIQMNQNLLNKFQGIEKQFKKQILEELQQSLIKLEQQYQMKENEQLEQINNQKKRTIQQIRYNFSIDNELEIKKNWRNIYKEKIQLSKLSQEQQLFEDLKNQEIELQEELTINMQRYKEMIRQNLIKLKQSQIENERLYLNTYYSELLQQFKQETLKRSALQIQKLELNQIKLNNDSFVKLEKSPSKVVFNPDLRLQKQELELQIRELNTKIEQQKRFKSQMQSQKKQNDIVYQILQMPGKERFSFLQKSLNEEDMNINLLKDQLIQRPEINDKQIEECQQFYIQPDQWGEQVSRQLEWMSLQKERLKFDKKKLRKTHEQLCLLSSTQTQIQEYNSCVDIIRKNQQILKNCEFMVNKLQSNLESYYQTKIINYLKENDQIMEDLENQKKLLEQLVQTPILKNSYFTGARPQSSSCHKSDNSMNQLQYQANTQKNFLRDLRDSLNKDMMSRMN